MDGRNRKGMVHPHRQCPFFKLLFPAIAVALVIALAFFWKPMLLKRDRQKDSGFRSLSSRILADSKSGDFLSKDELCETPALRVSSETANPRVSPNDKVASKGESRPDAGFDPDDESVIAAAKSADQQNKISGIRSRLLMEAAERALHSETPWADLSLVALAFKRAGDGESARYWFMRASRLASDPDDIKEASRALREVVKNAVSAGYYDIAIELIGRIPEASEKSRARAELVKAYARGRKFDVALQLAMTLGDDKARGVALRSIAEYEARYEGLESALQTLQAITDPAERDRAYGTVAGIRAGVGDSDGALTLLNRIKNSRTRDATVARIATIQERGGAVSIEALAGLIHDPTFRDETLRELIMKEAARLGVDVAESSINRIETEAARAKAYESLVFLQIRQGDLDGALARAQSIHQEAARFRALQAIAVAEVRINGALSGRNIANLIGDFEMRETTYGKIAQRAAVYGQNDGAVATIQFIDDPSERAMAFANVALTQARYGQDRSARILVQDATRELSRVESPREKARAQGLVAEVFAETGDSDSAMSTAAAISNSSLRDGTYQRVALSFAKVSEPALAEQSAQQIERETTRERALDSIATTLARKVALTDAMQFAARLDGHRQQVRFLLGVAGRKS